MQFDTKIAVVIRTDLEAWQKLNVAAFLTSGIAAAFPECIGENYADGSGTQYRFGAPKKGEGIRFPAWIDVRTATTPSWRIEVKSVTPAP